MGEYGWIQKLKVGDKVIVDGGRFGGESIEEVTKINPKSIGIGARKYRKETGWEITSDTWHSHFLREATTEDLAKVREKHRRARLLASFRAFNLESLTTAGLESAYAAAESAERLPEKVS